METPFDPNSPTFLGHDILREIVTKCGIREIVALYSAAKLIRMIFANDFLDAGISDRDVIRLGWRRQIDYYCNVRKYTVFGKNFFITQCELWLAPYRNTRPSDHPFEREIMIFNNRFNVYDDEYVNAFIRIDSTNRDASISYNYFFIRTALYASSELQNNSGMN